MATDWEDKSISFAQALKGWQKEHGWSRNRCAEELRFSEGMFNQWAAGASCSREGTIRRLMNEIDASLEADKRFIAEIREEVREELRDQIKAELLKLIDTVDPPPK